MQNLQIEAAWRAINGAAGDLQRHTHLDAVQDAIDALNTASTALESLVEQELPTL